MIEIEQHGNSSLGALLAIAMIVIGVAAIVVKAMELASDDEFLKVVGVLTVVCGMLLVLKKAMDDGFKSSLFGGCMLALVGFVMALSMAPSYILYWLTVIVVAELGLKIIFEMPLGIVRVDLGNRDANRLAGVALVLVAIAMMSMEEDLWDFFLYLVGVLLMLFGFLYLAQRRGKGRTYTAG